MMNKKHRALLKYLDSRLSTIRTRHAQHLRCAPGCAACCHGLFDVSVPDAIVISEGLDTLPGQIRISVVQRASEIQRSFNAAFPELAPPWFLNGISEERLDRFIDQVGNVRCPFLDERNACLIYDYRPVACRLEGIPMVDSRDGLFGDWCELNYKEGVGQDLLADLRLDYYEIQAIEGETTTFIATAIMATDFTDFTDL